MDSPNQSGPQRSWAKRLGILSAVLIPALLSGCTKEQIATGFFPVESKGATNHTEAYTALWNGGWIALMIVGCQKVQIISDKLCLSPKTVNTYRYRIFEKLSVTSDVELTLLAVRHGMVDANL